jgi:hypothetical protein
MLDLIYVPGDIQLFLLLVGHDDTDISDLRCSFKFIADVN